MGRRGRQIGKYCSLSSGGQKNESTALQKINLKVGASCKHFHYFNYTQKINRIRTPRQMLFSRFSLLKKLHSPFQVTESSKIALSITYYESVALQSFARWKEEYLRISRRRNGSEITCAHTRSRLVDVQRITSHSEKAAERMLSALL